MENDLTYIFSPKALLDLEGILNYVQIHLCNPKASEDLAVNVFKSIDAVLKFPESGMKVDNEYIIDKSLRYFIVDNYKVFYKHDKKNKNIIIVRIVYGKMSVDKILKKI